MVVDWPLNELPHMQNPRLDLLGRASNGRLMQIECQSTNDSAMLLRMAEYSLGAYRQYGQFPLQFVLYVGRKQLRMPQRLPELFDSFHYTLIDLREIDSAPLLASAEASDNALSILTRFSDQRRTVEQIVGRIAEERERKQLTFYLEALLVLAGLRGLEEKVEEAKKVPAFYDILENKVLGREYKRGLQEGRQEGERTLLRLQIEKRFGSVPEWASQRLEKLSEPELGELGLRLFEAQTLEELLPERSS